MARRGRPPHPDVLTPREWEVLDGIRDGLSNEEIADRLGISVDGAKYHVTEILTKLGLANRHDAARWHPGDRRPWWGVALLFRPRCLGARWLSPVVAGALAVAVVGGVGLLVWALVRTGTPAPTNGEAATPSTFVPQALRTDAVATATTPVTQPYVYSPDTYAAKLALCRSEPNDSTVQMYMGRRFIFLPRALYPDGEFVHGTGTSIAYGTGTAVAYEVTNAGPHGRAYGSTADCWSSYYEIVGEGEVDFRAPSAIPGAPDYVLHIVVRPAPGFYQTTPSP